MSKKLRNKYRPDYGVLYPNVEISSDVLKALKESDYKIEYMEYDLKRERFKIDPETGSTTFIPSREDSLDRLEEADNQFRDKSATPEDIVVQTLYIQELCRCIALLDDDEQKLISALFYEGYTEKEYGVTIGVSQTCISWRKRKILAKLKNTLTI